MGVSGGPKIPTDRLLATYQPGTTSYLTNNTTANFASDVATPFRGAVIGPRRTYDAGYGPAFDDRYNRNNGPFMEIQNIPGSIYTVNTAATTIYTISLWVRIVSFPTKYDRTKAVNRGNTNTTKTKRASLARFNFSSSNWWKQGWIEFGAMAPYYLNNNNIKNYKSIFTPISFGAAISGPKKIYSVYTDYKFNLNQWYLVTYQIQSNDNFSNLVAQSITAKIFVNEIQENIAACNGIAWRQSHRQNTSRTATTVPKRKRGAVAAQPGFLNRATGGVVPNFSSQSIYLKSFPDLTNLNYISYSPIKTFGSSYFRAKNGVTNPSNVGGRSTTQYQIGSGINFGQTYIYNTAFDPNIYTQFKTLYT